MILTSNYDVKMPVSGCICQLEWNSVGSYQGTGTIWYDKSGNNTNFLITGSVGGGRPVWSEANGFDFFGNNTSTNRMYMSSSLQCTTVLQNEITASNACTVIVDVFTVSASVAQVPYSMYSSPPPTGDDMWPEMRINGGGTGQINEYFRTNTGTYYTVTATSGSYAVGTRQNFTMVSSPSTGGTIFVDGVSKGNNTATYTAYRSDNPGPLFTIGMGPNYGSYNFVPFLGRLFGVWIWPRRLSTTEITQMNSYINSLHY